jgi:hypothetical protein
VFAAGFGLVDAVNAPVTQYQIVGLAFAVAGMVMLVGCACLMNPRWHQSSGRIAAIAAGLSGTLVGAYLALAQIAEPEGLDTARLMLWLGIVLTAVGAGVVGWLQAPRSATAAQVGPVTKGLASILAAVGLLAGGAQWWYTNQYLPGKINPALAIHLDATEYGNFPSTDEPATHPRVYKVDVSIKNTSRTTIRAATSMFSVLRFPTRLDVIERAWWTLTPSEVDHGWRARQVEWAQRLHALHIAADTGGHHVQIDQPVLVAFAVRQVIAAAKAGTDLAVDPADVATVGGTLLP